MELFSYYYPYKTNRETFYNIDTSKKLLILLNCFFSYEFIERTVKSIKENNFECDIIFLENPSKYSDKIKEIANKYKIYMHLICNENIEGNVFQLFMNNYKKITDKYKYIAMSEADVVLDKGALNEAIDIIDKDDDKVGCISIDLHLNYDKYKNLPLDDWVPKSQIIDSYVVGATGFQFIIFKKNFLYSFIKAINNKELSQSVALGIDKYYGISDSNLIHYNNINNKLWIRTQKYKLDHIGWEYYIDDTSEYVQLKKQNLNNGKIRSTIDINNYKFIELI
jgi:hypothetical protein